MYWRLRQRRPCLWLPLGLIPLSSSDRRRWRDQNPQHLHLCQERKSIRIQANPQVERDDSPQIIPPEVAADERSHAAFNNTSVNQSGWLIVIEWPDVVFSRTVQNLSDLHSSAALSKAAN